MASKTVALDREAMLRRNRREDETFSDAVKRLAKGRRSILEYAGSWKAIPAKEMERVHDFLRAGRKRDRERMARLFRGEP